MKLLTKALRAKLPKLYATDHLGMKAVAQVKFFMPGTGWTWYATEFDGVSTFFGLVIGHEMELGYFSLTELETVRNQMGLLAERDRGFKPTTLEKLQAHYSKHGHAV
jgi:hypothetical protein